MASSPIFTNPALVSMGKTATAAKVANYADPELGMESSRSSSPESVVSISETAKPAKPKKLDPLFMGMSGIPTGNGKGKGKKTRKQKKKHVKKTHKRNIKK